MRINNSLISALSIVISSLLISATVFSGIASGQLYNTGYYGGGYGQSTPYNGGYDSYGSNVNIVGLEGLQGFTTGESVLSLAVQPVTHQDGLMYFQVAGFVISSPDTGQAVAYALNQPFRGVIDPSRNAMQIDISNIGYAVAQAGYIDYSRVYESLRLDPGIMVVDIHVVYQGTQGYQTIFNVLGINAITPDGRMQSFTLQQPMQLIIDALTYRICTVTFPQMIDVFGTFFSGYQSGIYQAIAPIVFAQPVPVFVPVSGPDRSTHTHLRGTVTDPGTVLFRRAGFLRRLRRILFESIHTGDLH